MLERMIHGIKIFIRRLGSPSKPRPAAS